jgi:hypothetical protein
MDEAVSPKEEGFGMPPDRITEPCLTYMARIMELREFVGFYFAFVKASGEISQLIPAGAKAEATEQQRRVFEYDYSAQRPLVNEIMLSRAVESFDLYLTTILRDIFLARPEMLKSDSTIDVATIIDVGNYDDLIWQVVERKVHELSYKPLSDLRKFIESRTGIDLFPSQEAFELTILASEVRNLIAHNDCKINDLFSRRTKNLQVAVDVSSTGRVKIEDEWLRKASYSLDNIVFRFDERAVAKFGLHSLNRMSSFILRG